MLTELRWESARLVRHPWCLATRIPLARWAGRHPSSLLANRRLRARLIVKLLVRRLLYRSSVLGRIPGCRTRNLSGGRSLLSGGDSWGGLARWHSSVKILELANRRGLS